MREILFRAKTESGRWIEGDLIHYQSGEVAIIEKPFSKYGYEATEICRRTLVLPDTICQYTGLTDKNGNKIWENDILVDDICSVVRWDEEEVRFVIDDYGTKGCLLEYGWDEDAGEYGVVDTYGFNDFYTMKAFEVIGNIFDNPELLKGE